LGAILVVHFQGGFDELGGGHACNASTPPFTLVAWSCIGRCLAAFFPLVALPARPGAAFSGALRMQHEQPIDPSSSNASPQVPACVRARGVRPRAKGWGAFGLGGLRAASARSRT
jgi:hypothetical protein